MGNTWDYYDSFSEAVDWAETQAGFGTFPVSIWQCGSGFAVEMGFDGFISQSAIVTFYPPQESAEERQSVHKGKNTVTIHLRKEGAR